MVGRNKMPITFRGQRVKGLPEMKFKKREKKESDSPQNCTRLITTCSFRLLQNVRIPDSLPEISSEGPQKTENIGRVTPKLR